MNGMVNWKNINSSPIAALNRNRKLLDILCAKGNKADKGQRDLFVRSDSSVDKIGLYTASAQKTTGKVSDAIQDLINFEYLEGTETENVFIFGGVEYFNRDIPPISFVLSEDKKLDIPYGADIYDMKWPPRNQAQM